MNKRINITLPEATIQTIDRVANPGQRSRFIDQAVQFFIARRSTETLTAQLERAAIRDRDLDREIAADWFALDTQAWQLLDTHEKKRVTRGVAKSISRRLIPR